MLFLLTMLLQADPAPTSAVPARAITVRLTRPRELGERVLALFEGTKVSSPAAALAGYRRAKGGSSGLSKATEAVIATINPRMIAEWGLLDDASFQIGRSADGRPIWDALIPRDDGTFEALGTAFVLTDGASEPPINGQPVDRLGPSGAPLLTRVPAALVIASDRDALVGANARIIEPFNRITEPSVVIEVDPKALAAKGEGLAMRRVGEALLGAGLSRASARIVLEDDNLMVVVHGLLGMGPIRERSIDRRWLDPLPVEGAFVVFAMAIDPSPASIDAAFAIADRVEKADPARANIAPIRLRLGLLARAAGINPEVDVWPYLGGVSGFTTADATGRPDGGSLRLHFVDDNRAERVRAVLVPRLAASLKLKREESPDVTSQRFSSGDQRIDVGRQGPVVIIAIASGPVNRPTGRVDPPLAREMFRSFDSPAGLRRFVMAWPSRIKALGLPEAPPVSWVGGLGTMGSLDLIRTHGLKGSVKTVLDRLPFDPPPDVSTPSPTVRR